MLSPPWVSFNNYVDQILPNFDHLTFRVDNFRHFTYFKCLFFSHKINCGLSTLITYLPLLFHVVIEWPSVPFVENDGYGYGK